jgi:hypothetical protein
MGKFPHWYIRQPIIAWLFVLRMGAIVLIFILPGEWFFAEFYRLNAVFLIPWYLPVLLHVDEWALSHTPVVLTGLATIFMSFSLSFLQFCPWLFGFGFSWLLAKWFYHMTVRCWKIPAWTEYRTVLVRHHTKGQP